MSFFKKLAVSLMAVIGLISSAKQLYSTAKQGTAQAHPDAEPKEGGTGVG